MPAQRSEVWFKSYTVIDLMVLFFPIQAFKISKIILIDNVLSAYVAREKQNIY